MKDRQSKRLKQFRIIPISLLFLLVIFSSSAFALDLTLMKGSPNAKGSIEELYLVEGEAYAASADAIEPVGQVSAPEAGMNEGKSWNLKIFHFNDLHNHITIPHKKKGDTHYFSQMYKRVNAARESAGADDIVLFLSAGDDHTGSVLDELLGWDEAGFVMSPAYRTYTAGGLDLAVIGNHELDRGAAVLAGAIRQDAGFPLLSANVHGSKYLTDRDYSPAAIAVVKGLRIGFIGLTTPVDTHTGEVADPALAVASPVQTLKNLLPVFAPMTDVIVILSHCGFGESIGAADRHIAEGDIALAKAAAGLAQKPVIVVGGHTHTVLNQDGLSKETLIEGVPVVQAGGKGKFLGEFQAKITRQGNETVMDEMSATLYPLKKRDDRVKADDPKYAGLEHDDDYDMAFESEVVAPILTVLTGKLDEVLATANAGEDASPERTASDRYVGESAMANFMNDAVVARSVTFPGGKVDIALFNASGVNNGIPPKGDITFNDWYGVMPYADTLLVGEMTGREIEAMLQNNAKRIVRPEELKGDDPVDLKGYVSRGFLHFSDAIRYRIKLNDSATNAEATDITIGGRPIAEVADRTFKVAFNSYIGAGGFGEAWNGKTIGAGVKGDIVGYDLKSLPKHDTGLVYRNEIVKYIKEKGFMSPEAKAEKDDRLTVIP